MKLSANLSLLFTERPLTERVVAAAVAGFDGVEIQFPYEIPAISLKTMLERAGLPLRVINVPAGDFMDGGDGLAGVPGREIAFREALGEAETYAAMVRPHFVNVLPGRLAAGVDRAQALTALEQNLRLAAERFAVLGIGVLCEALNPVDVPKCLVSTSAELSAILKQVDHPNLAAQLDLYHMARQDEDLVLAIHNLRGQLGHVQFADCPGRGAPGSGQIDFDRVLGALDDAGFSGWLGAEYRPDGATEATLGWMHDWRSRPVP